MSQFDAYTHLNVALNPDGSLTRLLKLPTLPASDVELSGQIAVSRDVHLDPKKETWIRIFRPTKLPSNDKSVARLPIVVFFHGGGWIDFSADNALVHEGCNHLSSELPAIIISVEYRLAPEHRLPAQYDDAMDTLLWIQKQALDPQNGEKWLLDYGDFSRCYLYGCSNGGNIVFNAALRTLDVNLEPVKVKGLIMNQPMFGGQKRTKSEIKYAADQYLPLPAIDLYWELALPKGTDRDHRYANPMVNGPHREKVKSLMRCLLIGFGGDPMVDRQQQFLQMLVLNGVPVEARFDDIGFHGIDLIDSQRAVAVLNFIKDFIC